MSQTHSRLICLVVAVTALAYASGAIADNSLVAGPYFPKVEKEKAVIAFELNEPATVTVIITDSEGDRTFTSEETNTLHFVTIDGLSPGKTYDYSISAAEVKLGNRGHGQLRTASLPGESFSFAVYGDTRPGENQVTIHHAGLMQQISLFEPAFSLVLGDMVDDGTVAGDWRKFFGVEKDVLRNTAIFPVPGDNDHMEGKGLLTRYFPDLDKGYYSFEWGGVYFFGLKAWDTTGKQPDVEFNTTSDQYQWLQGELAKKEVQDAPFRIVFLHDPVFISRGRSSTLLKETFAPLFEKHRVDLVFASWHLYERSRVKGVNYVISGGGGAELIWAQPNPGFKSLAEAKRYHFCRVDVGAYGLNLRAIAEDGTVLDQVTVSTSLGNSSRQEEFSRFATRMAHRKTYGTNKEKVTPVYVFGAGEDSVEVQAMLRAAAQSLDVTLDVYTYNLQKKSVFELLLHAQAASAKQIDHLPAVFVGKQYLKDNGKLQQVLGDSSTELDSSLFHKQLDLTNTRKNTFASLNVVSVVMNGLCRNLTVGGFLCLLALGALLVIVAKRGRPVFRIGLVVLGAGFLILMIWSVFYFSVIKLIPTSEFFARGVDPFCDSPLSFIIQEMLGNPSYRGSGLLYLTLLTVSSFLPALVMMVLIKRFASKNR